MKEEHWTASPHEPSAGQAVRLAYRFRGLFSRSSRDELMGEVLVDSGLISARQLERAIGHQQEILFQQGKAVSLAEAVVELGYASEEEVLHTFNERYGLSVSSLSDNLRTLAGRVRGGLQPGPGLLRIPIWLQLTVTIVFVMVVAMAIFGYVVMERQKDKLFEQAVKQGMVSLNFFSSNARIPLLNDDILELNTLINTASSVEGQFYAFIVDNDGTIKAHTDHEMIEKPFRPFRNVEARYSLGDVSYFKYTDDSGARVLNLSTPIVFKDKRLGEVHVGLSIDFVRELFVHERAFLAGAILIVVLCGMLVAGLFSRRFSQPISTLAEATREIARGNYRHNVSLRRNDELGELAEAFNEMGEELYRQSLMREYFGKYVGPEVLDMIMRSPEKGWLRGRENEASVLFADIRGFTAYAESREPEKVVEKLNEFFEIATEVVIRHGGYVDKFIGDSVLAVFGVPVYYRDHPQRCLHAALELQSRFAERAGEGNPLLAAVGIGIASGVVLAGTIGSQIKTEYTVIGDCVNVASYLNDLAGPGEIIAGNGICDHFGDLVEAEALAPRRVKGKEEHVEIYRVRPLRQGWNAQSSRPADAPPPAAG